MVSASHKSILDEVLDPLAACFTPEVASRIVSTGLHPQTQAQLDQLAAKATAGTLSAIERAEYEEFVEAMDLAGIVKAKARLALARQTG